MKVDPQQQGVVVQHLLEVRHDPLRVHRVPGEAAGQLVVHAAPGHRRTGPDYHRQRPVRSGSAMVAKQELQHHRRRELRGAAESAVGPVVSLLQLLDRGGQLGGTERALGGLLVQHVLQRTDHPAAGRLQLGPAIPPSLADGCQQPQEVRLRKVGTAEERLAGRREQAGHRPATLAGQCGGGGHVDRVDVGPLLAVDLDRHEVPIEVIGYLGVLERLVRHDVAPVAGRVTHGQQNRLVASLRRCECLLPRPPIHRILSC